MEVEYTISFVEDVRPEGRRSQLNGVPQEGGPQAELGNRVSGVPPDKRGQSVDGVDKSRYPGGRRS